MSDALATAWRALRGDAAATAAFGDGPAPAPLDGPLPTGALASATVGAALLAAAELAGARTGATPAVALDPAHVAVAFTSERYARLDGAAAGAGFDPLSAYLPTADGWIRLHANYPHHRAAVMRALGHPRAGADGVTAAVAGWAAEELEAAVVYAGGCAAALRTPAAWRESEAGRAVAARGLLDFEPGVAGVAPPPAPLPAGTAPAHCAAGLRVLDLTRVIAGPVGSRYLAALGAEVLRVDAPLQAEQPQAWLDTGPGKRSVHLQLRNRPDRERLHRLLDDADVLVTGYRPGALDPFGLSPEILAEKHPHLCTVTLSAWGDDGPWRGRRGFDSLVQSATGIGTLTSPDGGATPGVLPAQALDHGTGYLIAAAALRALALRAREGRASHARVALARTAMWLTAQAAADKASADAAQQVSADAFLVTLPSALGEATVVAPPGTLDGHAPGWDRGPSAPGADAPYWQS